MLFGHQSERALSVCQPSLAHIRIGRQEYRARASQIIVRYNTR